MTIAVDMGRKATKQTNKISCSHVQTISKSHDLDQTVYENDNRDISWSNKITLVNVYVDLLVFTCIAGTS